MLKGIYGLVFGKDTAQGLVVQLFIMWFSSIFLSCSSLDGVFKKIVFTRLAALTGSFLSVCQKAVFLLFQLSKTRGDRAGDCRANPLECHRHDRTEP